MTLVLGIEIVRVTVFVSGLVIFFTFLFQRYVRSEELYLTEELSPIKKYYLILEIQEKP